MLSSSLTVASNKQGSLSQSSLSPTLPTIHRTKVTVSPTTTYYFHPTTSSRTEERPLYEYITPARTHRKSTMPGRVRQVGFAETASFYRAARDDEANVMKEYSRHAKKCRQCHDAYRVYVNNDTLCADGRSYARDVAQYIYSKAGKAFSVVDRKEKDDRVQIEVPTGCEEVSSLLRAVDAGLRINRENHQPVLVSHDRSYLVHERQPRDEPRREVIEIEPAKHRSSRDDKRKSYYVQGRGSLYEHEDRHTQRYSEEPVVFIASPRRSRRP